jgi:C4-dicarboxylate transporter, DcuC family
MIAAIPFGFVGPFGPLCGLLVIGATVLAVLRKLDVRLALFLGALVLGCLSGNPMTIVRTFLSTLTREQFVVPICTALGFAYVLRLTKCDQHLVQLLVAPLRRVRPLLVPGTVVVGFVVNITVVSQAATLVCIGAVLVPLLRAAGVSPLTIGAALLIGSSLGGELLNPGAPEIITVSSTLRVEATECVARVFPLLLVQLVVVLGVFWWLSWRAERKQPDPAATQPPTAGEPVFRVNLLKAAMPLVPLVLLFLTGPPLRLIEVPRDWLADRVPPPLGSIEGLSEETAAILKENHTRAERTASEQANSRLIGVAMMIGVMLTALVGYSTAGQTANAFFEGTGYAFTHIISLIVTATCFGKGVELIGLDKLLGQVLKSVPMLLLPAAGAMPWSFALMCGSGMATTQSLYGFFVEPARALGVDPKHVGAVVSIAAAAGRSMSPVAAVTLMSASLTGTDALALVRRVAVPVLAALVVMVLVAVAMTAWR